MARLRCAAGFASGAGFFHCCLLKWITTLFSLWCPYIFSYGFCNLFLQLVSQLIAVFSLSVSVSFCFDLLHECWSLCDAQRVIPGPLTQLWSVWFGFSNCEYVGCLSVTVKKQFISSSLEPQCFFLHPSKLCHVLSYLSVLLLVSTKIPIVLSSPSALVSRSRYKPMTNGQCLFPCPRCSLCSGGGTVPSFICFDYKKWLCSSAPQAVTSGCLWLSRQSVWVGSVLAASSMSQGNPFGLPEEQIPRHKCSLHSKDCRSVVVVHLH